MNLTLALLSISPLELIASIAIVSSVAGLLLCALHMVLRTHSTPRGKQTPPLAVPAHLHSSIQSMKDCMRLLDAEPDATDEPLQVQLERILKDRRAAKELLSKSVPYQTALGLIAEERMRQRYSLGWTPDHDDTHTNYELPKMAAVYAMPASCRSPAMLTLLPWDVQVKDPRTEAERVRELVKAGALIVAEIERMERQTKGGQA